MSEITDWEPKHSPQFEYSVFEYRQIIKGLENKLGNAEQTISKLQESIKTQEKLAANSEANLFLRFARLQKIAITGLEAVALILTAICEADTSHWQKKENLRNAIGVLATLQKRIAKADPSPLPFDDDF
jgi:hypothetical protein